MDDSLQWDDSVSIIDFSTYDIETGAGRRPSGISNLTKHLEPDILYVFSSLNTSNTWIYHINNGHGECYQSPFSVVIYKN